LALLAARGFLPLAFASPSLALALFTFVFFDGFRRVFFAGGFFLTAFFAVFFTAFFAAFLAGAAARLLFFARLFDATALVVARRVLRAFFALRFLTLFFLGVATTISFYCSNTVVGDDHKQSA
jgi:hypothetical protein